MNLFSHVKNLFTQDSQVKGILYFFITLTLFAHIDVASKLIVGYATPGFTNFARYGLLACFTFFLYKKEKQDHHFGVKRTTELIFRGCCQGCAGLCYLFALQYIPLNLAASIYFTGPLMIVVLSKLLLKEQITPKQIIAVCVGFCGVLLILRPSLEINLKGLILMLTAMMSFAFFQVYTRKLSGQVSTWSQMFYGNLGSALFTALFLSRADIPSELPLFYFALLLILVLFALIGQIFMLKAFAYIPAAVLAPFNYIQLVWVIVLSYLWLGESLDLLSLVGISTVIIAGMIASKNKKNRE